MSEVSDLSKMQVELQRRLLDMEQFGQEASNQDELEALASLVADDLLPFIVELRNEARADAFDAAATIADEGAYYGGGRTDAEGLAKDIANAIRAKAQEDRPIETRDGARRPPEHGP